MTAVNDTDSDEIYDEIYYEYYAKNKLSSTRYRNIDHKYKPIYERDLVLDERKVHYPDNVIIGVELDGKYTYNISRDNLRRVSETELVLDSDSLSMKKEYSYVSVEKESNSGEYCETDFIASVEDIVNDDTICTTAYTYDKSGNIETVSENGTLVAKYYYDVWNRLIREDNHKLGETYAWLYDRGGNILEKRIYELSTGELCTGGCCNDECCNDSTCNDSSCNDGSCNDSTCNDNSCIGDSCTEELYGCFEPKVYEYASTGNRDRLVCYNGENFQYDLLGNPTTYRNHNLEWTKVRKLAKFDDNTFEYNAEGIRFKKNNTVYTLDGDKILKETDGTNTITYYYGTEPSPIGFNYNGSDYYYVKNIQGDVIEICYDDGTTAAKYVYDAWGNHKIYDIFGLEATSTSHIGYINPIRYRSHYFDVETGLYYLGARYYDSETGRFINPDIVLGIGGISSAYNLFVYASNNPIMLSDSNGLCCHNNVPYGMGPDCASCLAGITQPNYDNVVRKEKQSSVSNDVDWEAYYREQRQKASGDSNERFELAKKICSDTLNTYSLFLGAGAQTALEASVLAGFGYAVTAPLNIAFHWFDPNLNTKGKWTMTGYETAVAAVGVVGTYGLVNCWNPSGPIALLIAGGYVLATSYIGQLVYLSTM